MIDAGQMIYSVAFDRPQMQDDGHSGVIEGWSPDDQAVKEYAAFRFLRGGETVMAARLSGRQPIVVTVYDNAQTRQIDETWRMRNARNGGFDGDGNWTGTEFNIRAIVPTDDQQFLEITVEGGVAV
ncbi:phage head completion protein [Pararhizobium gei]|uniref:phage head completion protein n=1 Tax=Pararhizobium gei TaxID=1395951 RepID=UPI0023DB91F4|nr:head-tail adaptor protein [Rhizobium gei]